LIEEGRGKRERERGREEIGRERECENFSTKIREVLRESDGR